MIKGIEILNKTPITEPTESGAIIFTIMIVFGVICGIICLTLLATDFDMTSVIFGVLATLLIISSIIFTELYPKKTTGRYKYEVTIDNDVSIQEVYDKYNVIDKDGKKWVIEEKDKEGIGD